MEKQIHITAVCGWALPEEWFRQLVEGYFPGSRVQACYPREPESETEAAAILGEKADWLFGYSLGSLWLLHHKNKIHPLTRVALLAPILAFPAEHGSGGKTPLGKLKYQQKMLTQADDYAAAMRGFFDLSGIRLSENDLQQPYSRDILIRGLKFLEHTRVTPEAAETCIAVSGSRDPLLDAARLKELIPHLHLVQDADHAPHKLLSHLSQHPEMIREPNRSSHSPVNLRPSL